MNIFNIFKKKKEDNNKMTTLEQVRKAYEDLSEDDKKSFHQSIADRVHESVAAQERADGNEDSQTAEDREHEALGAEHADGKGDVSELHETDKTDENEAKDGDTEADEKKRGSGDLNARIDSVLTAVEKLVDRLDKSGEVKDGEKLERAKEKYGMSARSAGEETKKSYTDEDVKKLLG